MAENETSIPTDRGVAFKRIIKLLNDGNSVAAYRDFSSRCYEEWLDGYCAGVCEGEAGSPGEGG